MVHAVTGSQLKCPSHVEAACYPNADVQEQALKNLPIACEQINIHTIYGSKYDFVYVFECRAIHDTLPVLMQTKFSGIFLGRSLFETRSCHLQRNMSNPLPRLKAWATW